MVSRTYSLVTPYQCQSKVTDIWQEFSNGKEISLSNRIGSLSVSKEPPFKYALPNGHKVYLYKCDGDKLYRKIGGFSSRVASCELRRDGKLIIVGEEGGIVRICTTDKNTYHLRKISAHKGCVNDVSFFADAHHAATIGTDAVVRTWDVALGTPIRKYTLSTGKEPAKAMVVGRSDVNLLCCGNLEGCFSVYDTRQPKSVTNVRVSNAVSALALNQTDEKLVIASGSSVCIWELRSQKFLIPETKPQDQKESLRLHYKTVTGLCVVDHPKKSEGEVLISVALDKLAKVTHLTKWTELHQVRCRLPLTAVDATPDCGTVIFGGDKGLVKVQHLDIRNRFSLSVEPNATGKDSATIKDEDVPGGLHPSLESLAAEFSGRFRGHDRFVKMTTDAWLSEPFDGPRRGPRDWLAKDERVGRAARRVPIIHETSEISRDTCRSADSSQVYTRADYLLSRFNHSKALTVVTRSRMWIRNARQSMLSLPETRLSLAIGVIRELIRRDTLAPAVAGRDAKQITRLLRFIRRNVWRREAATTCLELYHCILNTYSAGELASVSEFSKVNQILRCLKSNTESLNRLTQLIKFGSAVQSETIGTDVDTAHDHTPCQEGELYSFTITNSSAFTESLKRPSANQAHPSPVVDSVLSGKHPISTDPLNSPQLSTSAAKRIKRN
ncbi:unnamed protein product [Calicophoron daubneyi]|uniref:U3 small nucleolar RNA-associated protein 15 homolog n=1 Tax=Calicophoron daubneyi TaxID=300641 RepID=A0AAV2TLN4_CALDB